MKNLVIAFVLSLTTSVAFARSIDRTAVVAVVKGEENGMKSVAVLEDGRMQIQLEDNSVDTIKLSVAALARIKTLAAGLSLAELAEKNRDYVCEIYIMPSLINLYVGSYSFDNIAETGTFAYPTKLVLTQTGCSVAHEVTPKESYNLSAAVQLRAMIVILALNLGNK